MGAGELQIAVKIACISVAAESAKLGNRLNHSRIAAATGLTRKEVRTLFGLVNRVGSRLARKLPNSVPLGYCMGGGQIRSFLIGAGIQFH